MTTTVCSPFSCLNIPLPLSSLPQIGGASSNGSYLLLPGTYAHPLPPALQANTSTSAPLAGLQPFDNFTLSSSASPFYLVPSLQGAMLYDGVFWSGGQGEGFAQGRRAADNATFKAQSVILSPASWLKLGVVGGGEYVVWSSLADLEDGPLGIGRKKGFKVLDAQSGKSAAYLLLPYSFSADRVFCRLSSRLRYTLCCRWRLRLERRPRPERNVRLLARLLWPGLRAVRTGTLGTRMPRCVVRREPHCGFL